MEFGGRFLNLIADFGILPNSATGSFGTFSISGLHITDHTIVVYKKRKTQPKDFKRRMETTRSTIVTLS